MSSHILYAKHWRVRRTCPHCHETGPHLLSCPTPYHACEWSCLGCGCTYGPEVYRRPSPWEHKRAPVLRRLREWYRGARPGGKRAFFKWCMEA